MIHVSVDADIRSDEGRAAINIPIKATMLFVCYHDVSSPNKTLLRSQRVSRLFNEQRSIQSVSQSSSPFMLFSSFPGEEIEAIKALIQTLVFPQSQEAENN